MVPTITGPRRAASLQARDARDYLDPTLRRTTYGVLAAGVALFTAVAAWPRYRPLASLAQRIALLALLLLVVVIAQVATQWVARRPQPFDDDLLTAREAVRTSCVNLLGGIGVAFAWLVLSWVATSCTRQGRSDQSRGERDGDRRIPDVRALLVSAASPRLDDRLPTSASRCLIVEVDAQSPVPPYEQLRAQIATLAASGVLRGGDRLPTIRQLAGDLGLAAGTVARAYTELEAAGVLDHSRPPRNLRRRTHRANPVCLRTNATVASAKPPTRTHSLRTSSASTRRPPSDTSAPPWARR